MNLYGRFYVKANYIKAAKEDWVPCEVKILTDDSDTFLCIKSKPCGFTFNEEETKDIFADVYSNSTLSSRGAINSCTKNFTALCNLSEYKSCSMLTVTVNNVAHFAVKMIPSGLFGNKRLYMAMDNETEITLWMSVIKSCLGKKRKNNLAQSRDSLAFAGSLKKAISQDTIRTETAPRFDFEIDTMDNEVYEPFSAHDVIPCIVEQTGDWDKLKLSRSDCYIRLTEDRLELLDGTNQRVLHWFPYLLIRRFGCVGGVLRVDAGRRCSTGDGIFFFRCSPYNGQPVDALGSQIRQLALEAKQRLKQDSQIKDAHINKKKGTNGYSSLHPQENRSTEKSRPPPIPPKIPLADSIAMPKYIFNGDNKFKSNQPYPSGIETVGRKFSRYQFRETRSASIPPGNRYEETEIDAIIKVADKNSQNIRTKQDHQDSSSSETNNISSPTIASNENSIHSSKMTKNYASLQKINGNTMVDNENGVFIASPGKSYSTTEKTTNSDAVTHRPLMYDNVALSDKSSDYRQSATLDKILASRQYADKTASTIRREHLLNQTPNYPQHQGAQLHFKSQTDPSSLKRGEALSSQVNNINTQSPNVLLKNNKFFTNSEHNGENKKINGETTNGSTIPPVDSIFLSNLSSRVENTIVKPRLLAHNSKMEENNNLSINSFDSLIQTPSKSSELTDQKCLGGKTSSLLVTDKSKQFSHHGEYEFEDPQCSSHVSDTNDISHLNLLGLDEVLQELRDANDNVTAAVASAARTRRAHNFISELDKSRSIEKTSMSIPHKS